MSPFSQFLDALTLSRNGVLSCLELTQRTNDSLEHHVISGNIVCGITEHLPNFFIINKLSTLPKNYKLFKRDYSKLDSEALISEGGNVNWSEVLGSESGATDVNTVFQNFYDRITEIINKNSPIRKPSRKKIKSVSTPWVTSGIKTSIM